MWSLKIKLGQLSRHLPQGFTAAHGVRSLFPQGGSYSITALNGYVFANTYVSGAGGNLTGMEAMVGFDGAGRWFYGWLAAFAASDGQFQINLRSQAGFVALYSPDSTGHGFVDTSRPVAASCACGVDPWLQANWPRVLAGGVHADFQEAEGFDSLPDAANIWNVSGFTNFENMSGGNTIAEVHYPPDPPYASLGAFPDTAISNQNGIDWTDLLVAWWTSEGPYNL